MSDMGSGDPSSKQDLGSWPMSFWLCWCDSPLSLAFDKRTDSDGRGQSE
jgi:hypothetical protein